jgi:hypothetical protein
VKSLESSVREFLAGKIKCTAQNCLGVIEIVSGKLRQRVNSGIVDAPVSDFYEIRPRQNNDGFDLVSDELRHGPIWYAGPDATRNAAAYAKYHSWLHSRRAIIRVSDSAIL